MGNSANETYWKVDRAESKVVEWKVNDYTRMFVRALNMEEAHGHLQRILLWKITNSDDSA